MPDRRAGEAVDDRVDDRLVGAGVEEFACGACGGLHRLGGALADALRIAVAPDLRGEDGLVALVDRIADGLADEVIGNGVAAQAVLLELRPKRRHIVVFLERAPDLEVVAPAGELDAVVAHFFDEGEEFVQGQIRPLAGEEGDFSTHGKESSGNAFR